MTKRSKIFSVLVFSIILSLLLISAYEPEPKSKFYIINDPYSWNIVHSTDLQKGAVVIIGNKNNKKTEICLLYPGINNPSELSANLKIFTESNKRNFYIASRSKINDDYGYCFSTNDEEFLQFGESSTTLVNQQEQSIFFSIDDSLNFTATLYKKIGDTWGNNVNGVFVNATTNKLKFGAIDNYNYGDEQYKYIIESANSINNYGNDILISNGINQYTINMNDVCNRTEIIGYSTVEVSEFDQDNYETTYKNITKEIYEDLSKCNINVSTNKVEISFFNNNGIIDPYVDNGSLMQNVNDCGNLTTHNAIYNLTNNVVSADTCFTVSAHNITINGNGFNITYSNGSLGYAVIANGYNNLSVFNTVIRQGANAIQSSNVIYMISNYNNNIHNNTIYFSGRSIFGVYLLSSHDNSIYNNDIRGNSTQAGHIGFYFLDSRNNRIVNNSFNTSSVYNSPSFPYGIYISDSSSTNNTLNNNRFNLTDTYPYFSYNSNNSMDSSNLANGLPLNFTKDMSNFVFNNIDYSGIGQILLVNNSNVTFNNCTIKNKGILAWLNNNITISNSIFNESLTSGVTFLGYNYYVNIFNNRMNVTTPAGSTTARHILIHTQNEYFNITNNTLRGVQSGIFITGASRDNIFIGNNVTISSSNSPFYMSSNNINNSYVANNIFSMRGNGYNTLSYGASKGAIFFNNTIYNSLGASSPLILFFSAPSTNMTFIGGNITCLGCNILNLTYLGTLNGLNLSFEDVYMYSNTSEEIHINNLVGYGLLNLTNVTRNETRRVNITWAPNGNLTLNVRWWVLFNVTYNNLPLSNANVNITNFQGNNMSGVTNSQGILKIALREYTRYNYTNTTWYSNYTVNVSKRGYPNKISNFNLSSNILLNYELNNISPSINLVVPSENDGSTINRLYIRVNISTTSYSLKGIDNISIRLFNSSFSLINLTYRNFYMTNLVAYYHFNNQSAFGENETFIYDFSGNGNNANVTQPYFDLTKGYLTDGDFVSNGTNNNITFPRLNLNDSTGTGNFTVNFWYYAENYTNNSILFEYGYDILSKVGFEIRHGLAEPELLFYCIGNGTYNNCIGQFSTNWSLYKNKWKMLTMTYDSSNITIYLDSVNKTTNYLGGVLLNITSMYPSINGLTTGLGKFNGSIDEFAVWNRALSSAEIVDMYNDYTNGYLISNRSTNFYNEINVSGDGLYYFNATSYDTNGLLSDSETRSVNIDTSEQGQDVNLVGGGAGGASSMKILTIGSNDSHFNIQESCLIDEDKDIINLYIPFFRIGLGTKKCGIVDFIKYLFKIERDEQGFYYIKGISIFLFALSYLGILAIFKINTYKTKRKSIVK
jgi:hypothetical protein